MPPLIVCAERRLAMTPPMLALAQAPVRPVTGSVTLQATWELNAAAHDSHSVSVGMAQVC
jgi:hypothetical protein